MPEQLLQRGGLLARHTSSSSEWPDLIGESHIDDGQEVCRLGNHEQTVRCIL